MTETLTPEINIHAIPDAENIERRFKDSFDAFVRDAKRTAAVETIHRELTDLQVLKNEHFIDQVAQTIDDEALIEKRFIFISVNREYLESIGN